MAFLRTLFFLSLTFFCLPGLALPQKAHAQTPDSTTFLTPSSSRVPPGHSPSRTLRRALLVPGWGQVSNRQYWKVPIVYAGIGGMAYFAIKAGNNHRLYTRAFQYAEREEEFERSGTPNPFPEFEDEYEKVREIQNCTGDCEPTSSSLKPFRDNFRRNRDLSFFGIGLVYGLSVIDAFVSAHLLDFDVGEDLTVQLYPHPQGATALLRIGL